MGKIDTHELRRRYRLSEVIARHVKLTRAGREYRALCPFHAETTPSFTVNDDKGFYHCFGCGAHGDVIDFTMAWGRCSFIEACESLQANTLADGAPMTRREPSRAHDPYKGYTPLPPPENAASIEPGIGVSLHNPKRVTGEDKSPTWRTIPSLVHPYRKTDGTLIGYVLRCEIKGKKITPQVQWAASPHGIEGWTLLPFAKPRPLYGLDQLANSPDARVIVVEGEKAADAARELLTKNVIITWPGGTNSIKYTDWRPLGGKQVVLWPDADAVGVKAMAVSEIINERERVSLAEILTNLGCAVQAIDVLADSSLAKGFDAADALALGWTGHQVMAWAKPLMTTPDAVTLPPSPSPSNTPPPAIPDSLPCHSRAGGNPGDGATNGGLDWGPHGDSTPNAPSMDAPPTKEHPNEEPLPTLNDLRPFRPLGYHNGLYYYLPTGTRQVHALSAGAHNKTNLLALAPLNWWSQEFKKSWLAAANACMRACEAAGHFTPSRIRGRGAWMDGGRWVLHLGDIAQVDGQTCNPDEIDGRYIYPLLESMEVPPSATPLTSKEAHGLVDLCRHLAWEEGYAGNVLAGWLVASQVCGALPWRPHLWITGSAGSGKSTVMAMVREAVGGIGFFTQGLSTEAGLRQELESDARPVLIDETEGDRESAQLNIEALINLARLSSQGGQVTKGTQGGRKVTYQTRSMFCFASVNKRLREGADQSRFIALTLGTVRGSDRQVHYKEFLRLKRDVLGVDFASRLLARTVRHLPLLLELIGVFAEAAAGTLKAMRAADQLAPILAGFYLLHTTKPLTVAAAERWLLAQNWGEAFEEQTDEERLLSFILTRQVRWAPTSKGVTEITIADLLSEAQAGERTPAAAKFLAGKGIAVRVIGEEHWAVFCNNALPLREILRGTRWELDYARQLYQAGKALGDDAVMKVPPERFAPGIMGRGVGIRLDALLGEEATLAVNADQEGVY
ncbi:MAG: CHC2 zinc finger domain-containing protein [Pseudomonadota bacterium]